MFSIFRWFGLIIVGCCALYGAWHIYVTPLAEDAPERTGSLFQQFGQQGVALGTLLLGIVFILIGFVGTMFWVCHFRAFRRAIRTQK